MVYFYGSLKMTVHWVFFPRSKTEKLLSLTCKRHPLIPIDVSVDKVYVLMRSYDAFMKFYFVGTKMLALTKTRVYLGIYWTSHRHRGGKNICLVS